MQTLVAVQQCMYETKKRTKLMGHEAGGNQKTHQDRQTNPKGKAKALRQRSRTTNTCTRKKAKCETKVEITKEEEES